MLSDYILKIDIANRQLHSNVSPCGKCKLCPLINTAKPITNDKLNITEKIKGIGNCKERKVIYAEQCSRHKVLYIGQTGEQLLERFSKHCYDIKNKPDNSELAKHFHQSHNINDNIDVTILQTNIKIAAARRYREEKWISRQKSIVPHVLNTEIGDVLKRWTISTNSVTNSVISFDVMFI